MFTKATFVTRAALWMALAMVGACAVNTPRTITEISLALSEEEAALYDDIHEIIVQHYGRYDNEILQGLAQRLGEQLAVRNNINDPVLRVTVLDTPLFNAFSHPGGYIYLTRGLLAFLNTESELASVIAHEIAHLVHHDYTRHTRPVMGTADSLIAGPFAFAVINDQTLRETLLPLIATFSRGYGRELELETLGLGAEMLAYAGYDPADMLELWRALKNHEEGARRLAHEGNTTPSVYHGVIWLDPATDTRVSEPIMSATRLRTDPLYYVAPNNLLSMLNELIVGDRVEYGIKKGERIYHKNMRITLVEPKGWSMRGLTDGIVLYPSDERAFIAAFSMEADQEESLAEFMKSYFELDTLNDPKSRTFSGLEALVSETRLNTIFGDRLALISALYVGESAVVLAATADDEAYLMENHQLITTTLQSIRAWSEADEKVLKPLQLKFVTVPDNTILADLLKKESKNQIGVDQVRLLNRLYPDAEPKAGQTIKLVH